MVVRGNGIRVAFAAWFGLKWYNQYYHRMPVLSELKPEVTGERQVALINQDGQTVLLDKWKDKIVIVDFFFSRCPSICPKMTNNLQRLRHRFAGDSNIQLVSITVDPENDSALQLRRYAERFKLDLQYWELLTGNKKEIYRVARNGFKVAATDGDGGPSDFIHSEQFILLDPQLRIRGYYKGTDNDQVDQLILDIKKLKHENE
jgi:protein SCO1/2